MRSALRCCALIFCSYASLPPAVWAQTIGATAVLPTSTPAGVAAQVLVTSVITDSTIDPQSVNVQRLDSAGRIISTLGSLRDDGTGGDTTAGDKTFSLRTPVYETTPGPITLRVSAGVRGGIRRIFSAPVMFNITGATPVGIAILAPANLAYVNLAPLIVTGSIGDPGATVAVNGVNASKSGSSFSASVPLIEGTNTITAVATNAGGTTTTASIQVTLDTTPPRVTIESPGAGATTTEANIPVTGTVNDIVVGTVNDQQARVTVNGTPAQLANRAFATSSVALIVGDNIITATAQDRAGNSATATVRITRLPPAQSPAIRLISGNNQNGQVNSQLPAPLIVQLVNAAGQPVAQTPVAFRVTDNDGLVNGQPSISLNTNDQGRAQVLWRLGGRAGAGNNRVEANATGFAGVATFVASGVPAGASRIVVDSGQNQTGTIGEALPLPFIAIVTDQHHNRLGSTPVTFAVRRGNGSLNGQPILNAVSDSDGRVAAVLDLGLEEGVASNMVEATFAGNTGLPAAFEASSLAPGPANQTSITGVVLDNSNNPISGVTMRMFRVGQGVNNGLPVQLGTPVLTNEQGQFLIQPAPVGVLKLMADGSTAQPSGGWPTLEYDLVTVSGRGNTVGQPIYLPALDRVNRLCVTATTGGTLTLPQIAPGFSLTVQPGAATFPGGSKIGCISVTPVNPDKVPMVPGFGQQPRFVVTIQPVGTMFNPPAAITIPNVDGLLPRAVTEMYSYDHDLAAFVSIGTGTVSLDGSVIASDPGIGVIKAGWHCGGNPQQSGSAGTCPECQKCQGNACVADPAKDGTRCMTAAAEPRVCRNGQCVPITGRVIEVSFSGASFHGVVKDNGTPYGTPQWTEGGDRFPVSYTRNTTVTVGAKFQLSQSLSGGSIQVLGEATNGLRFQGAGSLSGDTVTFAPTASAQNLPNSIKRLDPFQIQWKLTIEGKTVTAGSSSNRMHVTLADPTTTPLYETLLEIGTRNADGKSGIATAVDAIWGDFKHPASGVKRADTVFMGYWLNDDGTCQTINILLTRADGNGNCGSWAQLFGRTLKAQGIPGAATFVIRPIDSTADTFLVQKWDFRNGEIRTGPNGLRNSDAIGDDVAVFDKGNGAPNRPCVGPGPDGHLNITVPPNVGNTTIGGDDTIVGGGITTGPNGRCESTGRGDDTQIIPVGRGAPNEICIKAGPNTVLDSVHQGDDISDSNGPQKGRAYPFLQNPLEGVPGVRPEPLGDAVDQTGITGQKNVNPPGQFNLHFVVMYNGLIYDPSYGVGPLAEAEHERQASAGLGAGQLAKKRGAARELRYTNAGGFWQ